MVAPSPAGAAGNTGLASLILPNPEPGWVRAPKSSVQGIVARLEKTDTKAAEGHAVTAAAELWRSVDSKQVLGITLSRSRWPTDVANLDQAARTGLDDECISVSGIDPTSVSPAPTIAGSLAATCSSARARDTLAAVVARKGDYLEMVEDIGIDAKPLPLATVEALAARQYALLPTPTSSSAPAIGGGLGLVIVAALVAFFASRSRRSRNDEGVGPVATGPGPNSSALEDFPGWQGEDPPSGSYSPPPS